MMWAARVTAMTLALLALAASVGLPERDSIAVPAAAAR
jgi:hypothetical protein